MRPVSFVLGLLLTIMGLGMLAPAIADAVADNPDAKVFLAASLMTVSVGVGLALANQGAGERLDLRQAFLLTTLAWVVLPAFSALPFIFSELGLDFTDAYFEAMSGLTTTGSTVIVGLDSAPPGLLLWRALLQWLGGIGIIVMMIAVLPMLQIGGLQIFRMESSDTTEKILPRARQLVGWIAGIYVGLSAICTFALIAAGLAPFDALAHMMTTIATGGFSTRDASVGAFDRPAVEAIMILFMLIGSLPFVLFLQTIRGRPLAIWRDQQARGLFLTVFVLITIISAWLVVARGYDPLNALRFGSFNIVSIMTGTGYSSADFSNWGGFAIALFFVVMFIGGCAGSTSCGIKIFRFQILFSSMVAWLRRLNRPHGVFVAHYNRRPVDDSVISAVISFLFLFGLCFLLLALGLSATGLDYITALSGAGTALANVGPGLGPLIGPNGNFAAIPDAAKWMLSGGMLLGRLELFTVLVLLTRSFWRG